MRRVTAGALFLPLSVVVYLAGGIGLTAMAGPGGSAWWIVALGAWALLALGGGVSLSAWLMTRDL
jgi:hypothetical protein